MSSSIGGSLRRTGVSVSEASALWSVAAIAWLITARAAAGMRVMPGTMGLDVLTFVGMWTLMMAAMMLPSSRHWRACTSA